MSTKMNVDKSSENAKIKDEEHKPKIDEYLEESQLDSENEFIKSLSKGLLSSSPNSTLMKRHPYEGMFEDLQQLLEQNGENSICIDNSNNLVEMSDDDDDLFFSVIVEEKNIVEIPEDLELESFMLESTV